MKSRLVLHVGMHKTGSTALQNTLAAMETGTGWEYLNFKHPNASNLVRQAFCKKEPPRNGNPQPSYAQSELEARELIRQRLSKVNSPLALISGEELRKLELPNLEKFIAFCKESAPNLGEVGAVAYVRAPISFLQASFQQRLKSHFVPLTSLIDQRTVDYARHFAALETALSRDLVSYRPYLRDRFPKASVINDFSEWMNLGPLAEKNSIYENIGLSDQAVRLLFIWRRANSQMIAGDGKMLSALRELEGKKLHISEILLKEIRPSLSKQYQWAERRMGWDMVEEPVPDQGHTIRSEADLMTVSETTLEWLGERSGLSLQKLRSSTDAVVEGLSILRDSDRRRWRISELLGWRTDKQQPERNRT